MRDGRPQTTDAARDHIRSLERARLRALVGRDVETAAALHGDDYQLVTPGGAVLSKDDYVGGIASGRLDYRVFEAASDIAVRIYDRAAVVRYQARIEMTYSGRADAGAFWHTDLYEVREGSWQAVWSQATRIQRR